MSWPGFIEKSVVSNFRLCPKERASALKAFMLDIERNGPVRGSGQITERPQIQGIVATLKKAGRSMWLHGKKEGKIDLVGLTYAGTREKAPC